MANRIGFWSLVLLFCGAGQAWTAARGAEIADPRQAWQLLDYIAIDYRGAVSNGEIVAPREYAEMQEFAANAQTQLARLPEKPGRDELLKNAATLVDAVRTRSSPETVARLSRQLADGVLAVYAVPLAPTAVPNLARGKTLFESTCSSCHGPRGAGDGILAKTISPPPIAFTDVNRSRERSPFSYYQAISQGVEGTAMTSFAALPERDRWALAFYASTLAYSEAQRREGERLWGEEPKAREAVPNLEALSSRSEAELAAALSSHAAPIAAFLRSSPTAVAGDLAGGVGLMRTRLAESLKAYTSGNVSRSQQLALSAYLDGFEPLEPTLAATNAPLLAKVEEAMAAYRSDVERHVSAADLTSRVSDIDGLISAVENSLEEQRASASTAFLGSFAILLREGVEALLIVVAIVAFLRKTERRDLMPYVHGGWIGALVAGLLTWGVATYLVAITGAHRETTEGISSLLAAVVLLSVGLWMHNKSLAGRWQEYLRDKLSHALSQRSAWFLAGLAFVAVYREVFETILFYAAMWTQGGHQAIVFGLLAATVALLLIAVALLRATRRLPIGEFFKYSSVLIAILAVVLVGKGIAALQEAGWMNIRAINGPRVTALGIYPNLQSVLGQLAVIALVLIGVAYNRAGMRQARALGP